MNNQSETVDMGAEGGQPASHAAQTAHPPETSRDSMSHGDGHGEMSMDGMIRDMRNRFVAAAVLSVPIIFFSAIGREVLGFTTPAPFVLRDDVF